LLITVDEQQRPANEVKMQKRHALALTLKRALKSKGQAHAVFHSHFVNSPLPFINSNQQYPKVVDPAAQKYYWRSTRHFIRPHTKRKKAVWARD